MPGLGQSSPHQEVYTGGAHRQVSIVFECVQGILCGWKSQMFRFVTVNISLFTQSSKLAIVSIDMLWNHPLVFDNTGTGSQT